MISERKQIVYAIETREYDSRIISF